jgi:hypothetical protein
VAGGGRRARRPAWQGVARSGMARLGVVCAVLAGLMLMHGNPASAASGCHPGMTVSGAMAGAGAGIGVGGGTGVGQAGGAMAAGGPAGGSVMSGAPGTRAAHAPSTVHRTAVARAGGDAGTGGMSCVATPGRGGPHLAAPVLPAVGVPVLAGPPGRSPLPVGGGRRGPPGGGRDLLLRVCVART